MLGNEVRDARGIEGPRASVGAQACSTLVTDLEADKRAPQHQRRSHAGAGSRRRLRDPCRRDHRPLAPAPAARLDGRFATVPSPPMVCDPRHLSARAVHESIDRAATRCCAVGRG